MNSDYIHLVQMLKKARIAFIDHEIKTGRVIRLTCNSECNIDADFQFDLEGNLEGIY